MQKIIERLLLVVIYFRGFFKGLADQAGLSFGLKHSGHTS